MKFLVLFFSLFFCLHTYANLPPTALQASGDASLVTTFNFKFPNADFTHSGTTATMGKLYVPGGGTGKATFTANGILLGNGASPLLQAAVGTTGTVLKGNTGAAPTWGAITLSGDVTGVLPLANGGTDKALTASAGSVVYSDADSFEMSAVGSSGQFLKSNGTGAPSWAAITLSGDITGILPLANGGTNANMTASLGGMLYSTASAVSIGPVGTSGQILHSGGAGAPTWSAVDLASATQVTGILPNANTTGTSAATGSTLVLRASDASFSAHTISLDTVALPTTTASVGQITVNGSRYVHFYGGNFFAGPSSGNTSTTSATSIGIGSNALAAVTSCIGCVGIGEQALKSVTSGQANVGIGYLAGRDITGADNVGIGNQALRSTTTGFSNVAVGKFALINQTTGSQNVAIGPSALQNNVSGDNNLAIGPVALQNGTGAVSNIAIGDSAGRDVTFGQYNILLGYFAGVTNTSANATTTGSKNVFIGYQAGPGTTSQISSSVAIGANAIVSASNSIAIGSSLDKTGVAGITVPTSALTINGSAQVSGDSTSCTSTIGGAIRYQSNLLYYCNGSSWQTVQSSTSSTPTVQRFTSGSGTYTTPAGVRYIKVSMVGGGGGGAGSGTTAIGGASNGGNTTFSNWTAGGGTGPSGGAQSGGAGGTVTTGTGTTIVLADGSYGTGATQNVDANSVIPPGGNGGSSFFGGAGTGTYGTTGNSAKSNTGSGGAGGSLSGAAASAFTGAGGGAGGYVEFMISSPSATYSYAVGSGGGGGSAGSNGAAGGSGAAGVIIVEEFY